MALAGLWENWRSPAGEWLRSFAIITTTPNVLCAELHNRVPLVPKPETWPVWLGEEPAVTSALKALLTPFPSDEASRTLRTSSGPTFRADYTAIDTAHPKVVDRNSQASVGRRTAILRDPSVRLLRRTAPFGAIEPSRMASLGACYLPLSRHYR